MGSSSEQKGSNFEEALKEDLENGLARLEADVLHSERISSGTQRGRDLEFEIEWKNRHTYLGVECKNWEDKVPTKEVLVKLIEYSKLRDGAPLIIACKGSKLSSEAKAACDQIAKERNIPVFFWSSASTPPLRTIRKFLQGQDENSTVRKRLRRILDSAIREPSTPVSVRYLFGEGRSSFSELLSNTDFIFGENSGVLELPILDEITKLKEIEKLRPQKSHYDHTWLLDGEALSELGAPINSHEEVLTPHSQQLLEFTGDIELFATESKPRWVRAETVGGCGLEPTVFDKLLGDGEAIIQWAKQELERKEVENPRLGTSEGAVKPMHFKIPARKIPQPKVATLALEPETDTEYMTRLMFKLNGVEPLGTRLFMVNNGVTLIPIGCYYLDEEKASWSYIAKPIRELEGGDSPAKNTPVNSFIQTRPMYDDQWFKNRAFVSDYIIPKEIKFSEKKTKARYEQKLRKPFRVTEKITQNWSMGSCPEVFVRSEEGWSHHETVLIGALGRDNRRTEEIEIPSQAKEIIIRSVPGEKAILSALLFPQTSDNENPLKEIEETTIHPSDNHCLIKIPQAQKGQVKLRVDGYYEKIE